MANGTEHWTEEHAKRQLEACARSGLSDASFAQREGIRARRLQWWRDRLGVRTAGKRAGRRRSLSAPAVVKEAATTGSDGGRARIAFAPAVLKKASRVLLAGSAVVVIETRSGARLEIADAGRVLPSWIGAVVRELERRR